VLDSLYFGTAIQLPSTIGSPQALKQHVVSRSVARNVSEPIPRAGLVLRHIQRIHRLSQSSWAYGVALEEFVHRETILV
jgi:hypothetical protein